ncbi:MAG: 50S ribosomal protein L22 [Candidatus Diapherotrites archaeon]|nr:50S ribosomal protein L22 [Candidatus Diapherotrites archaeon]
MAYSTDMEGARAMGRGIDMSPKHAIEVCTAIRGKRVEAAKKFLENVMTKEEHVPFKRFNKQVPHRSGGPGRYPVKAAKHILGILKNAEANADSRGMDTERLYIAHAKADKGRAYARRAAKGRMKTHTLQTVNVEIVLKEA